MVNDGNGNFSDETDMWFAGNTAFVDSTFARHTVVADLYGDGYNDILKAPHGRPGTAEAT